MSDSKKSFLIELVIGFVLAVAICLMLDVFAAPTIPDFFRILSDGFFAVAAVFLAVGGITFTSNGGIFDGIGFTTRHMIDRTRSDYAERRITFAEYQEERRSKAKSPKSSLLVGLLMLGIAVAFLIAYDLTK